MDLVIRALAVGCAAVRHVDEYIPIDVVVKNLNSSLFVQSKGSGDPILTLCSSLNMNECTVECMGFHGLFKVIFSEGEESEKRGKEVKK